MKLGFGLPVAGAWATPEHVTMIARRAEELGYASVWTFQRLLYAVDPRNDYPAMPGQPWPSPFERVLDPIVTLAAVATATERVRLGLGVLNLPFFTPVLLAKQLATLDYLSDGRLDVGVGLGWAQDEYAAVGVPFERRGERADEFLRCLDALWTQDVVEFHGEFYEVPKARFSPKPSQKPRPPILVGGYAEASLRRAVTLGDGYISGNAELSKIVPLIGQIREHAIQAGRDPDDVRVVGRGAARPHDAPQGPDRRPLWGNLEEIRSDVGRYASSGLTELFIDLNFDPAIGGPDTDPAASLTTALQVMEALADQT